MGMAFNCSLLDDGEKIKYYDWSKWVPTNPDVYGWEFVQVNPAYLGLSHNILGSVYGQMVVSLPRPGRAPRRS